MDKIVVQQPESAIQPSLSVSSTPIQPEISVYRRHIPGVIICSFAAIILAVTFLIYWVRQTGITDQDQAERIAQTTTAIRSEVGQNGQKGISGRVISLTGDELVVDNSNTGIRQMFRLSEGIIGSTGTNTASSQTVKTNDIVLLYQDSDSGLVNKIVINPQQLGDGYTSSAQPIPQ
jgi:hypothetical protein